MKKDSNKPKKSNMEKYFAQKSTPARDIVFGVMAVAGVIVWWYWFFYAIYAAIIGAVGLIFSRSMRIKDSEVDALIAKMEKDNDINVTEKKCSRAFDMRVSPIIKAKDGKMRTSQYVICEFDIGEESTAISAWRFDLIGETVTKQEYTLRGEKVELSTEDIMTPVGRRMTNYICCELFSESIPVDMSNVNASNIVEALCK